MNVPTDASQTASASTTTEGYATQSPTTAFPMPSTPGHPVVSAMDKAGGEYDPALPPTMAHTSTLMARGSSPARRLPSPTKPLLPSSYPAAVAGNDAPSTPTPLSPQWQPPAALRTLMSPPSLTPPVIDPAAAMQLLVSQHVLGLRTKLALGLLSLTGLSPLLLQQQLQLQQQYQQQQQQQQQQLWEMGSTGAASRTPSLASSSGVSSGDDHAPLHGHHRQHQRRGSWSDASPSPPMDGGGGHAPYRRHSRSRFHSPPSHEYEPYGGGARHQRRPDGREPRHRARLRTSSASWVAEDPLISPDEFQSRCQGAAHAILRKGSSLSDFSRLGDDAPAGSCRCLQAAVSARSPGPSLPDGVSCVSHVTGCPAAAGAAVERSPDEACLSPERYAGSGPMSARNARPVDLPLALDNTSPTGSQPVVQPERAADAAAMCADEPATVIRNIASDLSSRAASNEPGSSPVLCVEVLDSKPPAHQISERDEPEAVVQDATRNKPAALTCTVQAQLSPSRPADPRPAGRPHSEGTDVSGVASAKPTDPRRAARVHSDAMEARGVTSPSEPSALASVVRTLSPMKPTDPRRAGRLYSDLALACGVAVSTAVNVEGPCAAHPPTKPTDPRRAGRLYSQTAESSSVVAAATVESPNMPFSPRTSSPIKPTDPRRSGRLYTDVFASSSDARQSVVAVPSCTNDEGRAQERQPVHAVAVVAMDVEEQVVEQAQWSSPSLSDGDSGCGLSVTLSNDVCQMCDGLSDADDDHKRESGRNRPPPGASSNALPVAASDNLGSSTTDNRSPSAMQLEFSSGVPAPCPQHQAGTATSARCATAVPAAERAPCAVTAAPKASPASNPYSPIVIEDSPVQSDASLCYISSDSSNVDDCSPVAASGLRSSGSSAGAQVDSDDRSGSLYAFAECGDSPASVGSGVSVSAVAVDHANLGLPEDMWGRIQAVLSSSAAATMPRVTNTLSSSSTITHTCLDMGDVGGGVDAMGISLPRCSDASSLAERASLGSKSVFDFASTHVQNACELVARSTVLSSGATTACEAGSEWLPVTAAAAVVSGKSAVDENSRGGIDCAAVLVAGSPPSLPARRLGSPLSPDLGHDGACSTLGPGVDVQWSDDDDDYYDDDDEELVIEDDTAAVGSSPEIALVLEATLRRSPRHASTATPASPPHSPHVDGAAPSPAGPVAAASHPLFMADEAATTLLPGRDIGVGADGMVVEELASVACSVTMSPDSSEPCAGSGDDEACEIWVDVDTAVAALGPVPSALCMAPVTTMKPTRVGAPSTSVCVAEATAARLASTLEQSAPPCDGSESQGGSSADAGGSGSSGFDGSGRFPTRQGGSSAGRCPVRRSSDSGGVSGDESRSTPPGGAAERLLACVCRKEKRPLPTKGRFKCCAVENQGGEEVLCSYRDGPRGFKSFLNPVTHTWGMVCIDHAEKLRVHEMCCICGQFCVKGFYETCVAEPSHRFHQQCLKSNVGQCPHCLAEWHAPMDAASPPTPPPTNLPLTVVPKKRPSSPLFDRSSSCGDAGALERHRHASPAAATASGVAAAAAKQPAATASSLAVPAAPAAGALKKPRKPSREPTGRRPGRPPKNTNRTKSLSALHATRQDGGSGGATFGPITPRTESPTDTAAVVTYDADSKSSPSAISFSSCFSTLTSGGGGGSVFSSPPSLKAASSSHRQRSASEGTAAALKPKRTSRISAQSSSFTHADKFVEETSQLTSVLESIDPASWSRAVRQSPRQLYQAALRGELEKSLAALAHAIDPNWCNPSHHNRTAVHAAAEGGHSAILLALFKHLGNMDAVDTIGCTPLILAVLNGNLKAVEIFKECSVDFNHQDNEGKSCLHHACEQNNLPMIDSLLAVRTLNVNLPDGGRWTPLMWSAESDTVRIVERLVNSGASLDHCDKEKNTALHWASYGGAKHVVTFLMQSGASVNAQTVTGDTPLHIAARNERDDCVVRLLRKADRSIRNGLSQLPIDLAEADSRAHAALKNTVASTAKACAPPPPQKSIFISDISNGREKQSIACYNDVDGELPPADFIYVAHNVETRIDASIKRAISTIDYCRCDPASGGCCSTVRSCACVKRNPSEVSWYTKDRLIDCEIFKLREPVLYECNMLCSCHTSCSNRLVQHGTEHRLQLYKTEKMGWGVRTEKRIPRGSFVCEYVGELISDDDAEAIGNDSYIFDIGLEGSDDMWCVDACHYGNIARFINHSCEPNIQPIRVFAQHQDHRFPHMALFSVEDIEAGGQICFDYGANFWKVKGRQFSCECGTPSCSYKRKKR